MNKLAAKLSTFVIASAALFLVTVPAFAATAIDYANEQISGVEPTQEYSFDKKVWVPVYGTVLDISNEIGVKSKIYFRNIGVTATSGTGVTELAIPKRDSSSVVTGVAFASATNVITATNSYQYKADGLSWTDATGNINVEDAGKAGLTFSVRKKATVSAFASSPKTVTIAKQPTAPSVKYDEKTDSVIGVAYGQEYKIGEGVAWSSATAVPVGKTSISRWLNGIVISGTDTFVSATKTTGDDPKLYVYVRVKGTSTKAPSAVTKVEIPDKVTTAPTATLDFNTEKLNAVDNTMEYRMLTAVQQGTATYSSPAWKPISGNELDMKNLFSSADTALASVNTKIQVRYKAIPATSNSVATPASTPQDTLVIAQRPATPTANNITIDYSLEKILGADTSFEYKFSSDGDWITTATTSASANLKDYIPASDGSTVTLYLRKKTNSTTPASSIFTGVKIAKRPATPSAVYNETKNQITGVTDKMEHDTDPSDTFVVVAAGKTNINLGEETVDTAVNVQLRVKATTTAPASEVQLLTCIPRAASGFDFTIEPVATPTANNFIIKTPEPATGNKIYYFKTTLHASATAANTAAPVIGKEITFSTDWIEATTRSQTVTDLTGINTKFLAAAEVTPTTSGKGTIVKYGYYEMNDGVNAAVTSAAVAAHASTVGSSTVTKGSATYYRVLTPSEVTGWVAPKRLSALTGATAVPGTGTFDITPKIGGAVVFYQLDSSFRITNYTKVDLDNTKIKVPTAGLTTLGADKAITAYAAVAGCKIFIVPAANYPATNAAISTTGLTEVTGNAAGVVTGTTGEKFKLLTIDTASGAYVLGSEVTLT